MKLNAWAFFAKCDFDGSDVVDLCTWHYIDIDGTDNIIPIATLLSRPTTTFIWFSSLLSIKVKHFIIKSYKDGTAEVVNSQPNSSIITSINNVWL